MKLAAHGIAGNVLRWTEDWLSDTKQHVVLDGCFSEWRDVISTVLQGSELGPLLFIIYIRGAQHTASQEGRMRPARPAENATILAHNCFSLSCDRLA